MTQLTTRASRACVALVAAVTGAVTLGPAPAHAAEGPVAVSLTFDDGLNSQYDLAKTVLARHGVAATFYLNSGSIDKRGTTQPADPMTWARAKEIKDLGHEIGGHTLDHLVVGGPTSTLTAAEKRQQICGDRDRLVAQGFSPTSFAYPQGAYDDTAIQIIRDCGYRSARLAGGLQAGADAFAEVVPPQLSPYRVRILGSTTDGPITFEALRSATLAAYNNGGGWLPMLFHMVCYQGRANYDACMSGYRPVDAAVINRYLTWVETQPGVSVRTFSQVFNNRVPVPSDGPSLDSLSRGVLGQGARGARIVLRGSFDAGTRVQVSGPGVRTRVVARTGESLTVAVAVGAQAPVGTRTVSVADDGGGADSCDACLRIVPGPKITGLLRDTLVRGRVTWIPVRGTSFTRGTAVRVSGTGVRVRTVRFVGPQRLRVAVVTAAQARRTARSLTVLDRRTLGRDTWPRTLRIR